MLYAHLSLCLSGQSICLSVSVSAYHQTYLSACHRACLVNCLSACLAFWIGLDSKSSCYKQIESLVFVSN